jgi:mannose-6-phosphate isomerase-like protein (cupin superfamily)
LVPGKTELAAEPYLIEIPAHHKLSGHFTAHKGPELGYVLSGSPRMTIDNTLHAAQSGDTIYLARETPQQWENTGPEPVRLFWVTIR